MNKILYYFISFVVLFGFASCDTDDEYIDTTYIKATVVFIGSSDGYEVRYNGKKTALVIYGKENSTGKLEVYKTGKDTPEISEEITLTDGKKIELLKILGRSIAFASSVSEDEYTTFTPYITFSNGFDKYTVTFNDEKLNLRNENKIANDALEGTLKIIRNSDGSILYEENMTIVPESTINITELGEESFVNLSTSGGESDPESSQYTKIRFIYTADAFPGHNKLELLVYLSDLGFNQFTDPITIKLKAGQMSEFIQIDNKTFSEDGVNGVYDLIDENGNYIVDSMSDLDTGIFIGNSDYKFLTFRLEDSSENHQCGNMVLCKPISQIPW